MPAPNTRAQRLTLETTYGPNRINFDGWTYPDPIWLDAHRLLFRKTDSRTKRTEWSIVNMPTGESAPLYDVDRLERRLIQEKIAPQDAARLARLPHYVLHPNQSAVLFSHAGVSYLYILNSDDLVALGAGCSCEDFSPDGKRISYVRNNDLFVFELQSRQEMQLTHDGSATILNGRLDWVYQEELYGRDNFKGYWWSPDSTKIAYLQLDESQLKPFPLVDHIPFSPQAQTTNYPLAGDPNPKARLGIVRIGSVATNWVDLSRYAMQDFLVVRVGWTPDSIQLCYEIQDREQHWLHLNLGEATILQEERETWVSILSEPKWLSDGSFLWLSEESGWAHIYHYNRDGTRIRQVTAGDWEAQSIAGIDEKRQLIYFSGTKHGYTSVHTYRVSLNGGEIQKLTDLEGMHRSFCSPSYDHFADVWTDIDTPPQVRLHLSDGRLVQTIDTNCNQALAEYGVGTIEFLQVDTRDGFQMEAMMFKPSNFESSNRYPVVVYTYGGPHHPQVINAWGGEKHLWHRLLAEMGYIVWVCDNRTGSGKGAQSTWPLYRRTGELELRDIEDGIGWLKSQPYVDPNRIGIWGWSYGGYLAAYAMTHSRTFKIGIAGAAVTDWRNYDSVYTERYMQTPQHNSEGYELSSVVRAAANLSGKLLLIHGATDDNVHLQNAFQFAYALQKAGKSFDLMIYPRTGHAVTDPLVLKHLRTLMTDFVVRNL